jgi:zinc transporter 9
MAMLFSAGTFLYVATVHVMPELLHAKPQIGLDGTVISAPKSFTKLELFLMVVGSLCPLLLSLSHHH